MNPSISPRAAAYLADLVRMRRGRKAIEADLEMPGQTGKQRTPVVPLSSLHGSQPV